MFHFVAFMVVALTITAVVATLLWLLGAPVGLSWDRAWWVAVLLLAFVVPEASRLGTMVRGGDGASRGERAAAGVAGLGMLICGLGASVLGLTALAQALPGGLAIGLGGVLWIGGMAADDHFETRRQRASDPDQDPTAGPPREGEGLL